ncbi:MAG TPA: hypothetical protein VGF92_06150 [Stellaceae bacterium]|jgi:hypothetical protein
MKIVVALLALTPVLAGCATPPQPYVAPPQPYQVSTPYNEADFVAWGRAGPAHVRGQAFMKTAGGEVKTCAGYAVVLFPANALGRELLAADRRGVNIAEGVPADASKYFRRTRCDAQGNFAFSELAPLPWIIETNVARGSPTGSTPSPVDTQGGVLVREILLRPGDNQVSLTGADER